MKPCQSSTRIELQPYQGWIFNAQVYVFDLDNYLIAIPLRSTIGTFGGYLSRVAQSTHSARIAEPTESRIIYFRKWPRLCFSARKLSASTHWHCMPATQSPISPAAHVFASFHRVGTCRTKFKWCSLHLALGLLFHASYYWFCRCTALDLFLCSNLDQSVAVRTCSSAS